MNCKFAENRLQRFHNCHQGQRLVLVCNGPSLKQTDFSLIRGEVVMGLNKIFLGFRQFRFYPRYYVAINQRVIEQSSSEILNPNCIRFLRDFGTDNLLPESALTYLLPSRPEPRFHQDLTKGIFEGYTVTFAALQVAFYMGFASIIIIGMDHRYTFHGMPNEAHKLSGKDPNHFDPGYFSGHTWDNPDLQNSESFYIMAREVFEANGRRIIDCTINGACTVFEKGSLEEVMQ